MANMYSGIVDTGSEEPRFVHCDPCKYDQKIAMADTFCVQCNEYLCPQCKHFHMKLQATRNHTLTDSYITETKESQPLNLKFCDIHRTNEVKYYCNNHECVICTICRASIHSGCSLQLINEVMKYSSDKHHLNLTKDSIQELIQSFKSSIKNSSKSVTDVKQMTLHYRNRILSIKEKFVEILDQAIEDISRIERETTAKQLEECETEQVYRDAISDLDTLSRNIEQVIESNDAVATFSGNLKALKLREEYSHIERKMKTKSKDVSASFNKYKQLTDEMENCFMMCELHMKPTQSKTFQTEPTSVSQEEVAVTTDGTKKDQLEACFGTLASATRYPSYSVSNNIAQQNSKTLQDIEEQHATLKQFSTMTVTPDNLDNNLEERNSPNVMNTADITTLTSPSNILDQEDSLKQNKQGVVVSSNEKVTPLLADSSTVLSTTENQGARDKHIDVKTENPILYSKVVKTSPSEPMRSLNKMKLSTRKHYFIRTENDKKTCDITGSTFLPDGRLALCDHENMNIKLTNTDLEVTYSFKFDTKPWDITVTDDNELAVTLPLSKTVRFIAITNETMSNRKKFQVKQDVWGIDSYEELIIISLHDINNSNGSVEIRKHNGVLVKQIKSDMFGNQFFKSPGYVHVDTLTGNIFVSDGKKNAIFCFNQDGFMVRQFEDSSLRWPRKVINDIDKNLIICSRFSDSLKLLPPRNDQYRTLFSNCIGPQTVSYRESDKLLIVGGNFSDTLLCFKFTSS